MNIDTMLNGCLVAVLFAERDVNRADPDDDTSLESEGWSVADFTDATRAKIRSELVAFAWANRSTLRAAFETGYNIEQAGMDYYFTTAGHGVGFWDRGLGDIGQQLSEACGYREWNVFSDGDGALSID